MCSKYTMDFLDGWTINIKKLPQYTYFDNDFFDCKDVTLFDLIFAYNIPHRVTFLLFHN